MGGGRRKPDEGKSGSKEVKGKPSAEDRDKNLKEGDDNDQGGGGGTPNGNKDQSGGGGKGK